MYLVVKAIHVFGVAMFVGGMLATSLGLSMAESGEGDPGSRRVFDLLLRWDSAVTTSALCVVWLAGFTMAFGAGWFPAPWLMIKMVPVVVLTILHVLQGNVLRRHVQSGARLPSTTKFAPYLVAVVFATIAFLAVVKPF